MDTRFFGRGQLRLEHVARAGVEKRREDLGECRAFLLVRSSLVEIRQADRLNGKWI